MKILSIPVQNTVSLRMAIPWAQLVPLWRHLVWAIALFVALSTALWIHLDVQRLHMDLDRNDRLVADARRTNERLRLELEARQRLILLEHHAKTQGLSTQAPMVRLTEEPP